MNMTTKTTPINRATKFYGWEDFEMEKNMIREYAEGDIDFRIILYRIDHEKTNHDDLYGEVEAYQIRYKSPIELSCMLSLKPKQNKQYNPNGTLLREEWGNLEFKIHIDQLTELNIEINKGDYIGYPVTSTYVKFFTVADNDVVNDETGRLLGGKLPIFRRIICTPVDGSEFNG